MGQRLDRPSTAASSVPANAGPGAVTSSLSTTFSSSSASSTSSTSSNTSAVNNSNTQGNATSSNSTNAPPNSNSHHRHHRHRHRNHISRGSVPETSLVGASSTPNSSSTTTTTAAAAVTAATSDMSPRTRFRTEMARRGYTNSSSDLFFRLFQFPNQQSPTTTTSARSESTLTNSSSSQAANTPNIEPLAATPVTSNVVTASRATTGNSSGLSAFRFFNLGGGGGGGVVSSSGQTGELDSDLSSDEDEPHWNHNLNSLTQSLPFFFGVRDFKCFVCSKQIPADDVEAHIMMCLTKPRLTYNDDVLTDNKGECIICFEELEKGQTIARLPCLCIYHKHCIESWLERSQSCPGHPPD